MRDTTIVSVCAGSSCRKRKERDRLVRAIRSLDGVDVDTTRCLGICEGPVIVIDTPGTRRLVLAKVRSRTAIADVLAALRDRSGVSDRLRRRRVKSKRRRKALATLDR